MLFLRLRRFRYHWLVRWNYRQSLKKAVGRKKVILGSGITNFENWMATDYPFFDATSGFHWRFIFGPRKADNLLAEHVLEHLTEQDVEIVLSHAKKFLMPGGIFRIAVPDKFHPNPDYIEYVRPGGSGAGADDHKSFWDYRSLADLGERLGYKVELQEYYDEEGKLHLNNYSPNNGIVLRSQLNKSQKNFIPDYSSLVVDLMNPVP